MAVRILRLVIALVVLSISSAAAQQITPTREPPVRKRGIRCIRSIPAAATTLNAIECFKLEYVSNILYIFILRTVDDNDYFKSF